MARPVVSQAAENLYTILAPMAYDDENQGWPLLIFCEAWAGALELVDDYIGDGTTPSWSNLVDIDRCPNEALPWLAQLVGVVAPPREAGEIDAVYWPRVRDYIRGTPGFLRGGVAAIVAAAQKTLTGTKTVIVRERWGGPYKLQIRTKTSETPDSNKTMLAIRDHKPGGITLDYNTVAGQDYTQLINGYADYQAVFVAYVTYQGVLNGVPGT